MPRARAREVAHVFRRALFKRHLSTPRPVDGSAYGAAASNPTIARLLNRTPKFLHPTISALHNAPLTHITAFLLLHEITAIVPLFGLAGAFHYYHWLPPYFAEGAWVVAGLERFGRYFRRKGWIGADEEAEAEWKANHGEDLREVETTTKLNWWNRGEGGLRWVVEFATAYAVVKALLPLRIVISVWGAPWFARWTVIPVTDVFKRLFSQKAVSGRTSKLGVNTTATGSGKTSGS